MSDPPTFDSLQNRIARGEELSAEEERLRLAAGETDPLARRELELFAELRGRLDEPDGALPNVALALAGARGVKLRVLGPDSTPVTGATRLRGRRGLALAAGSVTLLAAAGAWFLVRGTDSAPPTVARSAISPPPERAAAPTISRSELVFVSGDVRSGGGQAAIGQHPLATGARVTTAEGRACLTVDPGIDVCLGPESEVLLESLDEAAVRVRVQRGTAVAALSPRVHGHRFSLLAGDVVATARGTVFAVDLEPAGAPARVTVVEGKVAVRRGAGSETEVGAHSSLSVGDGAVGAPAAVGRTEEARLHSLLSPRELWQGNNLGVLEIGQATEGDRVLIDEHGPFELPLSLFVSTGRHRVALRGAERDGELGANVDVEAGAARRLSVAELGGPRASAALTAKDLLVQARKKLSAGDPRGALTLYRELRRAHPRSSEATTVLVTLGKLELDLGAPERALPAFDTYLERGGPLVPEALSGRVRALRALGRADEERRAIEQYLARFPTGFEAPSLKKRLATLSSG